MLRRIWKDITFNYRWIFFYNVGCQTIEVVEAFHYFAVSGGEIDDVSDSLHSVEGCDSVMDDEAVVNSFVQGKIAVGGAGTDAGGDF